jgi:hypothetical protein
VLTTTTDAESELGMLDLMTTEVLDMDSINTLKESDIAVTTTLGTVSYVFLNVYVTVLEPLNDTLSLSSANGSSVT